MSQWDLGVLAASLRQDSGDLSLYAGFLLNTLSDGLPPDMVRIERKTGLFGRREGRRAGAARVGEPVGDRRFTLHREASASGLSRRSRTSPAAS